MNERYAHLKPRRDDDAPRQPMKPIRHRYTGTRPAPALEAKIRAASREQLKATIAELTQLSAEEVHALKSAAPKVEQLLLEDRRR